MFRLLFNWLFGLRAKGERLREPMFRSVFPTQQPSEEEWKEEFKVSRAYSQNQNSEK